MATKQAASAIHIIERIRASLSQPGSQNIFSIIAHYGHGKSHFALVLANYFGRRSGDPVLEKILARIEACADKNTAYHFRSFKENADKPQLVVRLSGDGFTNLRQGFLRALRRALDEHEATRDYPIKAVTAQAAEWLRGLSTERRERAEKYLDEKVQMDFEAFVAALEQFDTTMENLAREVSKYVNDGWPVDFGHDANLREIIDQVMTDLCTKPDAPFYRMVILFDEMGLYAEKWCHNRMAAGDLAPQQLIEACNNWPGKLALVAFLQREIAEFVKQYGTQDEFRKWAERFPDETRFKLESCLEKVIEGLLIKQRPVWNDFARDFLPQITAESGAAWRMLPTYQASQKWAEQDFSRIVGVGAFPLHPLTTGLLCNLTFTQGSRTVISFVDTAFQSVREQPAVQTGRLNWVWPIRLVDEFAGNFADQASFGRYEHAVTRLGANTPADFYQVLQALFLYEAGGIKKYPSQAHALVLAALCGLPQDEVCEALRQLDEDYSIIRYAKAKSEYEFAEIGATKVEIRQKLQRAIVGKNIGSLAAKASKWELIGQFPFPESEATGFKSKYGVEGDEWRLKPVLFDATKLSLEHVKQAVREHNDPAVARGLLIYAVSGDDAELDVVRGRATQVLNELRNGPAPSPVVIAVPQSPTIKLGQEMLMREELASWGSGRREEYGESYLDALRDSDRRIEDELKAHLCNGARYFVPSVVESKLRNSERAQLDHIAERLFEEAFPHRVPARSHIIKAGNHQGNTIVATVSLHLLVNEVDMGKLQTKEQNLVNAVLREGTDKWGVLTARNTIKDPSNEQVQKAWEYLNREVLEDRPVDFGRLTAVLRGMPYGFDDYTLTLLYAVWIGKHKNELRFTGSVNPRDSRSQSLSLADFQEQMKKARDFIKWLETATVQVQRPGKGNKRKANTYLNNLRDVTSYQEARALVSKADGILASLGPDDELRMQITEQVNKLVGQCEKVQEYEKRVLLIRAIVEKRERAVDLIGFEEKLPSLPETFLTFEDKLRVETKKLIEERLKLLVEKQTQQRLHRIESYEAIVKDLETLRASLHKSGREGLERSCIEALTRIENEHGALKAQQEEARFVAQAEALRVEAASLAACREMAADLQKILDESLAQASDKARRKVQEVQRRVNQRITNCQDWLAALTERVSSVAALSQARQLRDEIIARASEYANTAEEETLLSYKQQVEATEEELAEAERHQAVRLASVNAYLGSIRAQATRVIQAQAFHDALREFAQLRALPPLADGMTLTEAEESQVADCLNEAEQRVTVIFEVLTGAKLLGKESDFERREEELELALTAIVTVPSLPAAWRERLENLREAVKQDFENWQITQRKLTEARRLAEESARRQTQNRKLAEGVLKQAERAHTLGEMRNAASALQAALAGLEPPCEEQAEQLERARAELSEREQTVRGWISEILPESLLAAWTTDEIQELRQKVVSYEARCVEVEELLSALSQTRTTLDERSALLNQLTGFEQDATTINRCQERLAQLEEIEQKHPEATAQIVQISVRLCEKLERFQGEQRQQAERWLAQFSAALERDVSIREASELLRKLDSRPAGLEERDDSLLASARERLTLLLDHDLVVRIVEEFRQLQTAEQRAGCLLQMIELCKPEGLPDTLTRRLTQLLAMGAVV